MTSRNYYDLSEYVEHAKKILEDNKADIKSQQVVFYGEQAIRYLSIGRYGDYYRCRSLVIGYSA